MIRVATPEERNRLLHISDELIEEIRGMHLRGMAPQAIISILQQRSVPKPGATLLLRKAGVMSLGEAKQAVHHSEAYSYRRTADEAFEDSFVASLEEIERSEAA